MRSRNLSPDVAVFGGVGSTCRLAASFTELLEAVLDLSA